MRCPILPAREFSSRVRRTPLCSTHLFHGIAWKRWKSCETTIMPGRESKGSRDYARRPPRGRFTSSPNRPSRVHRQADSDTMKRQCSILTSRSTRRRCASSEIRRFLASGSTRMFSRSRTAARVNGIALGAHPSRTVVQSQIAADSHLRAHFHY